ncbi:MAG TPA: hypothetical protein VL242_52090, partial [Sorangium sp.]|nr:hypothetical protein [Sorangium sp.]
PADWAAQLQRDRNAAIAALRGQLSVDLNDSVVAGAPVYAVDVVRAAASGARFAVRAVASQPRPHFHRPTARAFQRRPRHEHAILLIRG